MNRVYKLVFNRRTGRMVVAAEITRSARKSSTTVNQSGAA